jgi:rubrerythrin
MTNGSEITGTRDEHYNLVSVLYHTLQAGETYDRYIRDAEQGGDSELAQFFRDCQQQDTQRADRAKELLHKRLG